jgi:hypothetical protein
MPEHPGRRAAVPVRRDRSALRLAGRALLTTLAALAALPAYLSIGSEWRPAAVRLAAAAVVAAGCARAGRWAREARDERSETPVSALDAPPAPHPPAEFDARFLRLRDDLVAAARSRRYFDVILWPRLSGLAATELTPPPARRGMGWRGPSRADLARLIGDIEARE